MIARAPAIAAIAVAIGSGCAEPAACGPWTREAGGACRAIAWTVSEALGDPGARAPAIAVDDAGRWIAAWEIAELDRSRVIVAAEGEALREPVASLGGSADMPDVAARDRAIVVLRHREGADDGAIVTSVRGEDGTWRDPGSREDALSFAPRAYEPRAAVSPGRELLVVWNQWRGDGYGVEVATLDPEGVPLSRPSDATDVLSPEVFFSNAPRLALAADGGALVAWYQSLGGPLRVFASERASSGAAFERRSAEDVLSGPERSVDSSGGAAPVPALAEGGRAAIAWGEELGAGAIALRVAYRARREDPWTILGDPALDDSGTVRGVRAAFAPDGTAWIACSHRAPGARAIVHLASISAGGELVSRAIGGGAVDALEPALAISARGEIALAWTEIEGASSRVVIRSLEPDVDGVVLVRDGASAPALAWDARATTLAAAWIEDGRVHVATAR